MIGKINSITNTNKNFSFKSIKVRKDGETFKLMQDYMNNAVYSGKAGVHQMSELYRNFLTDINILNIEELPEQDFVFNMYFAKLRNFHKKEVPAIVVSLDNPQSGESAVSYCERIHSPADDWSPKFLKKVFAKAYKKFQTELPKMKEYEISNQPYGLDHTLKGFWV